MPSFATAVECVKPAIVSVKVMIESAADGSGELSDQMNNLRPQGGRLYETPPCLQPGIRESRVCRETNSEKEMAAVKRSPDDIVATI